MSASRRHIPYLSYHKGIIREICRPQKDDLLIIGKGLGLRRIICALLKTYDKKEDLILVVNATPSDEAGIGDELGIMGVRDPGFRILTHEMTPVQRNELYRHGGIFSVTSKILVNDFLQDTVPAKLITGIVVLHAERVSSGSLEEFAVRLYRRHNQSGFTKAFSDEPEIFAHGMSPLRDMLTNLNMTNAMIWPRFNEAVKVSLATRTADVIEMYQPMTDLMRQCQDSITACMEAMLVELKRDHSLNLDLDDINVRNAQFKSFDTIVRMRLKPVWHKVGQKTKIHVAALTELRNLHTWLLEYDSATFASYINTLQRQFLAVQHLTGPAKHIHDWFQADAAAILVSASQGRVSRKALTMDNSPDRRNGDDDESMEIDQPRSPGEQHEDELEAMREVEERQHEMMTRDGIPLEEEEDIIETFATQTQTVRQNPEDESHGDEEEDDLRPIGNEPPPVFRPIVFGLGQDLSKRVKKLLRKGHEPVLEEQPKWSLLARVLKEIEDTINNVQESHADQPGTNIVLIMTSSDRTCLQLRQYLTTMAKTDPPFGAQAGRKMMETLFLSNWQHEKNGERLSNPNRMENMAGEDEVKTKKSDMEEKRLEDIMRKRRISQAKRRRHRGGASPANGRSYYGNGDDEVSRKRALILAQSAFGGDEKDLDEDAQMQWALSESSRGISTAGTNRPLQTGNGSDNPATTTNKPVPAVLTDAGTSLLAKVGVVEEDDLDPKTKQILIDRGLLDEDWDNDYGLLRVEDTVIIRPYGGEDDDIMLQELRPRFVVMYEPNLGFIRRLEVYKNCNPGLALRVYQMQYANSFEEDRYLSTITREGEAFKKLIEDKQNMVIPIYNNNPRAPMRDSITRAKTTYSSRNAGGGDSASEDAKIIVDIREMGALLPSLIDAAGMKVIPATLTIGDYILTPKMCVERKALPDLESSFANGRLYTQCEAMTAHYEICILLIEFEEDKYGLRTQADAKSEAAGRTSTTTEFKDTFYLQSRLVLLSLHFPRLRIIWSSSPQESVKILSDLKLNHDEPDEKTAVEKGNQGDLSGGKIENAGAVEMLRAIPGVSGHSIKYVLGKVESLREFVEMDRRGLRELLGVENGDRAFGFLNRDESGRKGGLV